MDMALLVARLVLGAVFAVSGAAKLVDLAGSRKALAGFGVPEPLAEVAGVLLPLAELVVAGLLLPATTGAWGSAAALALLLLFVAGIAANLVRGRTPDCHCFGALHSEPVGPKTLVRNAVLAAVAAFAAIEGWDTAGTSATAWIGRLGIAGAALLVASLGVVAIASLTALAFVHLLRQHGRLLLRLDRVEGMLAGAGFSLEPAGMPELGLEPGTEAPAFALDAVDGGKQTLADLLEPGLPLLLVFTSPTCGPCKALLPKVAGWQSDHAATLTIALLSSGEPREVRGDAWEHKLTGMLLDEEHRLYDAYEANGTPSAVLVGADGKIASWMASGSDWIERLVDDSVPAVEPGIPVGSPAPSLVLSDLDGAEVRLEELWNRDTVLLFWRSTCGFCRQMHEALVAWEASAGPQSPSLVVISSEEAEEMRAEGFRARVLLDTEGHAAEVFFAGGTPMGVRIDTERRVASVVAAGADAVFELLEAPVATS